MAPTPQKATPPRSGNGSSPESAVERLISLGGDRGWVTLEEVSRESDAGSSLDELKAKLSEHSIQVVEAPRRQAVTRKRKNGGEREYAEGEGGANDPVRVYLREMGQVSLLTREGEVEIAMRIESGEHDKVRAMVGTPFGLRRVLELADLLRKNKIQPADVIDGVGEEHYPLKPEEARKAFLAAATRARRAQTEIARKEASIANPRTGDDARERLREEILERYRTVVGGFLELRFSKARIQEIRSEFERVLAVLEERNKARYQATRWFGVRPDEFVALAELSARRSRKGKEALARLKGDPERIGVVRAHR
jgi:RNA polymerase primary sigma factor